MKFDTFLLSLFGQNIITAPCMALTAPVCQTRCAKTHCKLFTRCRMKCLNKKLNFLNILQVFTCLFPTDWYRKLLTGISHMPQPPQMCQKHIRERQRCLRQHTDNIF